MVASMASLMQYMAMTYGITLGSVVMQYYLKTQSALSYAAAFPSTVIILGMLTVLGGVIFGLLKARRIEPPSMRRSEMQSSAHRPTKRPSLDKGSG